MPYTLAVILIFLAGGMLCYLIGSVNFAVVFSRAFARVDVRDYGSGNAGMTNVIRSVGMRPGIYTFICDFLKGAASVAVGRFAATPVVQAFAPTQFIRQAMDPAYGAYICAFFCLIGHLYPLFFSFKGGKGAAASAGMMLLLDWRAGACVLGMFLVVFLITRIVSLGSIIGAAVFPVSTYFLFPFGHAALMAQSYHPLLLPAQTVITLIAALYGLIIIIRHQDNIRRLLRGEERAITRDRKRRRLEK